MYVQSLACTVCNFYVAIRGSFKLIGAVSSAIRTWSQTYPIGIPWGQSTVDFRSAVCGIERKPTNRFWNLIRERIGDYEAVISLKIIDFFLKYLYTLKQNEKTKNQINKQILKTLTLLVWHNLNMEIFVILLEDYLFMEEQLNFFFAFPSMLSLPSKGDVVRVPVVQPLA